ncbi:MAG: glycerol kinase [Spirochaetes bacterium]|nr:MAG: glycerol kinase [Spirochaetota bacterium]
MAEKKYVGALDQGTTSTRFILFNREGEIVCSSQAEHRQLYPKAGLVEHDPQEIWEKTCHVIDKTLREGGVDAEEIASIGITNQRETTVVWDRRTGKPCHNAIVWQDTRTGEMCRQLAKGGDLNCYRDKTGLPLATYFSGPKVRWILDKYPEAYKAAKDGEVVFGTIDTWLLWNLTGGSAKGVHVTDPSNAGRTLLMGISSLQWDEEMLKVMDIPRAMLPEIRPSSDPDLYGYTDPGGPFGRRIPISGILGDQQAALFGQTCFSEGEAKSTYGTGSFLIMNTGETPVPSGHGLLTTVGYKIGDKPAVYALEGSIAVAGSLVQWFRDNFGLIKESAEIEALANTVEDNGGIYFVPAFSGLFAPYWKSNARGIIIGLTHYINKGHVARAILEATAFQTREILEAMEKDSGTRLKELKVDGGMTANELLMQFQADILDVPVIRPRVTETTSLGAAYAAGLATGFWKGTEELREHWKIDKEWVPGMSVQKREAFLGGWRKAVSRTFDWLD